MASIPKQYRDRPLKRGPHAGMYPVRWRATADGPRISGYLPRATLLADYTAYEQKCWTNNVVPEPPEKRYGSEDETHDTSAATSDEPTLVDRQPLASGQSIRSWLGTRNALGDFFRYSTKPHGPDKINSYLTRVQWSQWSHFADKPMREVTSADIEHFFHQRMACVECVRRVRDAGKAAGKDVPWSELVPRTSAATWDQQRCGDHETRWKKLTYESDRQMLNSIFSATRSRDAQLASVEPVASPVPSGRSIFAGVLLRSDKAPAESDSELLRYALSHEQVLSLMDALPPQYRALPVVLLWTLNRAGQEMSWRIGDVEVTDPGVLEETNLDPHVDVYLHVRNFERRVHGRNVPDDLRTVRRNRGKTNQSNRKCMVPAAVAEPLITHLREYRSTPDVQRCVACQDGVRHWPANSPQRNPHDGCDFDSDAPLFVNAAGGMLDQADARMQFEAACERVGLTEDLLGWRPQLRHFRSTGTTLLIENDCPIEILIDLGGWRDRTMIDRHYKRLRPDYVAGALKEVASKMAAADDPLPEPEHASRVQFLTATNRRLAAENKRLRQHVAALGGDPDGPIAKTPTVDFTTGSARRSAGVWSDEALVLNAIETLVRSPARPTQKALLDLMELGAGRPNYRYLDQFLQERRLPEFPSGRISKKAETWTRFRNEMMSAIAKYRQEQHKTSA